MITFLRRTPSCRIILVEKTDRLYRNLKDWVTIDELSVEVHFVKENVVLCRDSRSSEKFVHGIKVLMPRIILTTCPKRPARGRSKKPNRGSGPLMPR